MKTLTTIFLAALICIPMSLRAADEKAEQAVAEVEALKGELGAEQEVAPSAAEATQQPAEQDTAAMQQNDTAEQSTEESAEAVASEDAAITGEQAPAPSEEIPAAAQAPAAGEGAGVGIVAEAPSATGEGIDRGSWYFGLGLALGQGNLTDESFLSQGSAALGLRAGIILFDQLLVGPEVLLLGQYNEWAEQNEFAGTLSSVLIEVTGFPLASLPLSVSGGLGWGSAMRIERLADDGDDPKVVPAKGNGTSWMAALGWDLFAGEGFNLGVQARYDGSTLGDQIGTFHAGSLAVWFNFY